MPPDALERAVPELKDPSLLRQQAYVDGQWIGADSGATMRIVNPATGRLVGTAPDMGAAETRRAIEAANTAWPAWRARTARERSVILRRWYDLMMANLDDLALILTTEQGKPLAEAKGEVTIGAAYVEWFAEEARRVYGDVIPSIANDRRILVVKQPVGVCAAITPWNFPSSMITRKVAPALAAGCCVVIKPAEATPYSRLRPGRARPSRRLPARRAQHGDRRCAGDRRRDVRQPPRAQALLHRLHRGRPAPHEAGRADHQEALAGARRQRALHRVRRCRSRCRGRGRHAVEVPQRGADLHLRQPPVRAGRRVRRLRAEADRQGARAQGRAAARSPA